MADLSSLFPVAEFSSDVVIKPIPWTIRGMWQLGKINFMFGAEKAGKSRLLNWLLVNLFTQPNVFDLAIDHVPKRILYLAGEEPTEEINARMLRYAAFAGVAPRSFIPSISFIQASGMKLNFHSYRLWLEQLLLDGGYDMLVADPLRRLHDGDENDNSVMSAIFNDMRRWSNNYGITQVILHHTGKLSDDADLDRIATWSRGASDLAAILDTAAFVQRLSAQRVKVLRAGRFAPLPPLTLADGFDEEFVFRSVPK